MSDAAREYLDASRARNDAVHSLAVSLSVASRIEPELLRAARLGLVAGATVAAEADLWFSPLIASRSALFAVMDADAADALRAELAADGERLARARRLVSEFHAAAPPAIRQEEEIIFRLLANPRDPGIPQLFLPILAALQQGRTGLARWAVRALPRLPQAARDFAEAWQVAMEASTSLGVAPVFEGAAPAGALSGSIRTPTPSAEEMVPIGVRLFDDFVQLTQPPDPDAQTLDVPDRTPIVVELSWDGDGARRQHIASVPRGGAQTVEGVGHAGLRLTTAALDEFAIEPLARKADTRSWTAAATVDGMTARVYRGVRSVMLAFDVDEKRRKGLAGFAIERTDPDGRNVVLDNRLTFEGAAASMPSTEAPLQTFHWFDAPRPFSPGIYEYSVTAMYFSGSAGSLQRGPAPRVGIHLVQELDPQIDVGFTAPTVEPTAGGADSEVLTGGRARELLFDVVGRCQRDPSSRLDVFAYEIDHPDIVSAFISLGPRLRMVVDDSKDKRRRDSTTRRSVAALEKAGCHVVTGRAKRFAHNKVLIRSKAGEPVEVLTGSLGLTVTALRRQHHHVVLVSRPEVARLYAEYFDEWFARTASRHTWASVDAPGLPAIQVARCPAPDLIDRVTAALTEAESSVIFSLGHVSRSRVAQQLAGPKLTKKTDVYGLTYGPGADTLQLGMNHYRLKARPVPGARVPGNGKYIVVDFNREDAVVFAGSASFADGSAIANGDNVIAIHDPACATAFAVDAMRMIDAATFRARASRRPAGLVRHDGWTNEHFHGAGYLARRRRLLIASPPAVAEDASSAAEDVAPEPVRPARSRRSSGTRKTPRARRASVRKKPALK